MGVDPRRQSGFESDAVAHGFFGRQGGVSEGIFSSLNCGVGSADRQDAVIENRSRVAATLGNTHDKLMTLHQIHSNICVVVDAPYDAIGNRPQADALVTDKAGLTLGILTADCAPVLFRGLTAEGRPIIGAAHAGWGGALKGVLENTIKTMLKQGLTLSTLKAVVGPCIGPQSYEVSSSFRDEFLRQTDQNAHYFAAAKNDGHYMFDLPAYCQGRLQLAGVRDIKNLGQDTYSNIEEFFSFRRSTHNQENDYGRQLSTILIRP